MSMDHWRTANARLHGRMLAMVINIANGQPPDRERAAELWKLYQRLSLGSTDESATAANETARLMLERGEV